MNCTGKFMERVNLGILVVSLSLSIGVVYSLFSKDYSHIQFRDDVEKPQSNQKLELITEEIHTNLGLQSSYVKKNPEINSPISINEERQDISKDETKEGINSFDAEENLKQMKWFGFSNLVHVLNSEFSKVVNKRNPFHEKQRDRICGILKDSLNIDQSFLIEYGFREFFDELLYVTEQDSYYAERIKVYSLVIEEVSKAASSNNDYKTIISGLMNIIVADLTEDDRTKELLGTLVRFVDNFGYNPSNIPLSIPDYRGLFIFNGNK